MEVRVRVAATAAQTNMHTHTHRLEIPSTSGSAECPLQRSVQWRHTRSEVSGAQASLTHAHAHTHKQTNTHIQKHTHTHTLFTLDPWVARTEARYCEAVTGDDDGEIASGNGRLHHIHCTRRKRKLLLCIEEGEALETDVPVVAACRWAGGRGGKVLLAV